MNSARTVSPLPAIARKISDISNSLVGQMSGQCVKPKKTRWGAPFRSRSVTILPDAASVSLNGPPTADADAIREDGASVT